MNTKTLFLKVWLPFLFFGCNIVGCFVAAYSLYSLSISFMIISLGLGLLAWSLIEYALHRFLLHLDPKHPFWGPILTPFHGGHHASPDDPSLYVARLSFSGILYLLIFGVSALLNFILAGNISFTLCFIPGMLIGYLGYEWVHYAAHRFKPRTPYARWYRRNHFYHHFENPNQHFGVTSPLWDIFFETR